MFLQRLDQFTPQLKINDVIHRWIQLESDIRVFHLMNEFLSVAVIFCAFLFYEIIQEYSRAFSSYKKSSTTILFEH